LALEFSRFKDPETLRSIGRDRLIEFFSIHPESVSFFSGQNFSIPATGTTDPINFDELVKILAAPPVDIPIKLIMLNKQELLNVSPIQSHG
jgi:hypothetical protein